MAEGAQRRLAAIVSADVVGYSLLMGRDAGNRNLLHGQRQLALLPTRFKPFVGLGEGLLAQWADDAYRRHRHLAGCN